MSRICTKCKIEIPDSEQLEPQAEKYPLCNKCWEEWKEMRIMVMNEMHLDMSLADHRKVVRKHEKIFVGVMTPEGDYVLIDYKTGHSTPTKVPDSLQLNLYCMAIQEKFGKFPTLASFFYVEEPEGGQWFHYNVTPEKVAEVKLKLEEHVDAISKEYEKIDPDYKSAHE